MPKFTIYAKEKVYYMKVVEATSIESLREQLGKGEIDITSSDIVDGESFDIYDIEESE